MTKSILVIAVAATLFSGTVAASQAAPPPYYKMEPSRRESLVRNARALRRGDAYNKVVALLGPPTRDRVLYSKQGNHRVARVLYYYVAIWENGFVNEKHDQFVRVSFDDDDRVKDVMVKITDE